MSTQSISIQTTSKIMFSAAIFIMVFIGVYFSIYKMLKPKKTEHTFVLQPIHEQPPPPCAVSAPQTEPQVELHRQLQQPMTDFTVGFGSASKPSIPKKPQFNPFFIKGL